MSYLFRYKYILFCLLVGVIASASLLHPGFPPTHDGEYHVIRFHQFYKTLASGMLYPRWEPDLNFGYGVPLLNYYYPFPNYAAALFHFFGVSFVNAFKYTIIVAVLIGSVFSFLWAKRFWGNFGGCITAVLYTFSPYHFLDIYIRGSSGEIWALAFFPAFLWTITLLIQEQKKKHILSSTLFLSIIIFSHNILSYMFFLFLIPYIIFLLSQKKEWRHVVIFPVIVVFFSLLLTAIFWMPALFERSYVQGLQIYDYQFHFPEVYQLLFPSWGSGFSSGDLENEMSFQLGVSNIIGVLGSILVLFSLRRKHSPKKSLIIFFLIALFIVIFFMLPFSKPFWRVMPLFPYFQFPWRFLSLAILFMAFLGGSFFSETLTKKKIFAGVVFLGFSIVTTLPYTKLAYYHYRDDAYYLTRPNFIDGTNTPGNAFNTIWFHSINKRPKEKFSLNGAKDASISILSQNAIDYSMRVHSGNNTQLFVNTAYFPGWLAEIDGKRTSVSPDHYGRIMLRIPQGEHIVRVHLGETFIQLLATIISCGGLLLLFLLLIRFSFATIKR